MNNTIVLRPHVVSRWSSWTLAAMGVAIAALLVPYAELAPSIVLLGLVVGGAAVATSVRSWRMQVLLTETSAHVRGILWNREIARSSIDAVSELGWLGWRDRDGRRRWTPLTALWVGGAAPPFQRHSEECMKVLRDWAGIED